MVPAFAVRFDRPDGWTERELSLLALTINVGIMSASLQLKLANDLSGFEGLLVLIMVEFPDLENLRLVGTAHPTDDAPLPEEQVLARLELTHLQGDRVEYSVQWLR